MRHRRKGKKLLAGRGKLRGEKAVHTILLSELVKRKGRMAARVDFLSGN